MINLKKLLVVGAMAATFGLTNVNASSYIGTKKYNFKDFDITNVEEGFKGLYEYKGDLFVASVNGTSYKIVSGDKLKLEESDKTLREHLYELYPNTVIESIDYTINSDMTPQIGMNGIYLNGTPFGAGGQRIEGIETDSYLDYSIFGNYILLIEHQNIPEEKYDSNIYVLDGKNYSIIKTIKSSEILKSLNLETTNKQVFLYPLSIDNNSDPYFAAKTYTVEDGRMVQDNNVYIYDFNGNKVLAINTGEKELSEIIPINKGTKFIVGLSYPHVYDPESGNPSTDGPIQYDVYNLDGTKSEFIKEEENGMVYSYENGILLVMSYTSDKVISSLYDENLNLIKKYDGYVSYSKVIDEESDIMTRVGAIPNLDLFMDTIIFGKSTSSIVSNDEYLIYSYDENHECEGTPGEPGYNCWSDVDIKTMELLTVEDSKKVNVTGILKDKDGNPLKDYTVELHSTVRTTKTDKNGYFKFDNVEEGKHTLIIKDDKGTTLATKEINVIYGEETKLDGDTLTFNEKDNGVNINLKLDGTNLSIASVDKGVTVPKTFDTLTNSIIVLITLTLSTLFIIKKSNKIKYLKRVNS